MKHQQEQLWSPGSADTVCPRPPLMTQVQHFVSRIKKRQRWDVQTMWVYDLDLWSWRSWHLWLMRVVVLHPYTKFEVCRPWCTVCVSVNGPGDIDLWPFDLETGMRVASKVGNLLSKFGHAKPLDSRIIRYVRDGRADILPRYSPRYLANKDVASRGKKIIKISPCLSKLQLAKFGTFFETQCSWRSKLKIISLTRTSPLR